MKKYIFTVFFIVSGCILFLSGTWIYFQKTLEKVDLNDGEKARAYEKHYLMISNDRDKDMWQSIYKSAASTAKDKNAYVELLSPDKRSGNTQEDCLRIGIASNVDGIILEADGSKEEKDLIAEASLKGIPVVTVLTDDSSSARISFVGVNSYQIGTAYTEELLGLLKPEGKTAIMFLMNADTRAQESNLAFYQVKKELEEKKTAKQDVDISQYAMNSKADFDTEEVVRDIFVKEDLPDVLVCMDSVVTECVYQALIDYNQVGNVQVIGFYYSDSILDAISKGIISSSVTLDMTDVGEYSINALEEYSSLKHTNGYYSVGQNVITRENVREYRKEAE